MLGHRHRFGHQPVGVDQPVDEADLVEALRGEAEAQRHLHRDRIGQVGDMAVIPAAEQPALRLRDLEYRLAHRDAQVGALDQRSEEHTSELQSLMRISYAVFCLKKKKQSSNNEQYS